MRNSKATIVLLISVICLFSPKVLAIKESFPNDTVLQPTPDNSLPNISGNVDWPNNKQGQDQNAGANTGVNADTSADGPSTPPQTANSGEAGSSATGSYVGVNGSANANNNDTTGENASVPTLDAKNSGTQNGAMPSAGAPENPSTENQPNFSNNNPSASDFVFPYDSSAMSPQENTQTQNTAKEDAVTQDGLTASQNDTQPQKTVSGSAYAWAIFFVSIILVVTAFILWKLKKISNKIG